MEQPQEVTGGFDLNVHKRDKAGKIVAENNYDLHCISGKRVFERPPGSAMFYGENGVEIPFEQLPQELQNRVKKASGIKVEVKQQANHK